MEAVERKNPDLKIGYVPVPAETPVRGRVPVKVRELVPAEIPVPAETLAWEEMPAKVRAPVPDRM